MLAIIPDDLENELDHPLNAHVKTYEQIIEWCKSRTTKSRQKVLAAQRLKQVVAATGRMAPLTNEAQGDIVPIEKPPTWAALFDRRAQARRSSPRAITWWTRQKSRLSVTVSKLTSALNFTW